MVTSQSVRSTRRIATSLAALSLLAFGGGIAHADANYFDLSAGPLLQDWSNLGLITTNDDWSGVASIQGYRGDNLTAATGTDPQTILAPGLDVIDVNVDQTDPNVFNTGGVAEFQIANPTVALNGSGTADAPFLLFYLNGTGRQDITVSYDLRDIDGSGDNSTQQVALQYRVGTTGDFINLGAGYVADASTANSATQVTPVSVVLPSDVNNQSQIQVRVMTTNAVGNDEWIGVDNISVSSVVPGPSSFAVFALGGMVPVMTLLRRRRAQK